MNKNLIIIYVLIMLECRLSLEDASKLFQVDAEVLKASFNHDIFKDEILNALKYLKYETECYQDSNKRGLFKACIYIRKLRSILSNPNKEELKRKINDLYDDLKGPDIRFVLKKGINGSKYTKEEKELILKYELKYGLSGKNMEQGFHIDKDSLYRWENALPEGELKTRLSILREYLKYKYADVRSKK